MWRKVNPCILLEGIQISTAIIGNIKSLKNLKIELPCYPATPLLDVYAKEMKSISQRTIWNFMFIKSFFMMVKIWNQSKCLQKNAWIRKTWNACISTYVHRHIHMYFICNIYIILIEYYSSLKKRDVIYNNVDEMGRHCAKKIIQVQKAKYCMTSLICGI